MKARTNSQVIVAAVLAFALGVGAGFFVEHQRLKKKSHKTAPPKTAVGWFARPTAACPALKSWNTAVLDGYLALLRGAKTPWPTTQKALLATTSTATTSMKTLLAFARPNGKTGLNFLITYQGQTTTALQHASSQASYSTAAATLTTTRVKNDNAILTRAAAKCSKTSTSTT